MTNSKKHTTTQAWIMGLRNHLLIIIEARKQKTKENKQVLFLKKVLKYFNSHIKVFAFALRKYE